MEPSMPIKCSRAIIWKTDQKLYF